MVRLGEKVSARLIGAQNKNRICNITVLRLNQRVASAALFFPYHAKSQASYAYAVVLLSRRLAIPGPVPRHCVHLMSCLLCIRSHIARQFLEKSNPEYPARRVSIHSAYLQIFSALPAFLKKRTLVHSLYKISLLYSNSFRETRQRFINLLAAFHLQGTICEPDSVPKQARSS